MSTTVIKGDAVDGSHDEYIVVSDNEDRSDLLSSKIITGLASGPGEKER